MHTDYECQISALHSKIEYDKADFEKRMEEIENDFRDKLQVEQRNCDRRMSTLFQRMEEKDEEISQLVMQQKQLAETASSNSPDNDTAYPRLPLSIDLGKTDKNSDTVQAKDERDYIELQSVIEQLKNQQAQADDTICQLQQEIKSYQNKLNKQSTNTELTESRLQQLFMDENTQKMMHAEARVENLKSEQEQTIQELEEVHKSEKRVLKIQYETQLDQITKAQRQQLQKQLTELEDERDRLRKENNLLKKESETLQKQNTDYRKCAKESTQTQKELHTQENKQAIILAKELLSILSGNESEDDSASLSNMLRKVIRSATMLQYRSGGTADQYGENKSYDDHYYY
ncbi:hypothetical protein BDF20DRAFT_482717 [Mycotypha africana]|uniref:uncharacterized protein n=1 Tax=Mycotypha africana TaxID=64632 RepID=UPI0023012AC3|nr:uncharacterized protein BDF20DRAFT_482717 [Mycotypha africana]KAI8979143.1 hypothetical protein BDF20DRAFT_482717 [Mycotypha africana]